MYKPSDSTQRLLVKSSLGKCVQRFLPDMYPNRYTPMKVVSKVANKVGAAAKLEKG